MMKKNTGVLILFLVLILTAPGRAAATYGQKGEIIDPGSMDYEQNLQVSGQNQGGVIRGDSSGSFDDPFFDDWTEKDKEDDSKDKKKENAKKDASKADGEIDYSAGITYDMHKSIKPIEPPKLTVDDPVNPPENFGAKAPAPEKTEAMDIDYHAGITFDMNKGIKPIAAPKLTLDDPDAGLPSGEDYDTAEDEAPNGEFGDGERIL